MGRLSNHFTEAQKNTIACAYKNGAYVNELSKEYRSTDRTIKKLLLASGVELHSANYKKPTNTVDHSYFDKIDTENKAYWVGFLAADGCVRSDSPTVQLVLKAADSPHLDKYKTDISFTLPVRVSTVSSRYGPRQACGVCYTSARIVFALSKHGIVPRKSLILTPSTEIPTWLMRHYWRGVVDGDGCLYRSVTKRGVRSSVSLVGSKGMVAGFKEYVGGFVKSEATVRPRGNIFSINYEGKYLRDLVSLLYGAATVFLDRKMALATEFMSVN